MSPSESISPTAHYTGFVWARNGLSHAELETTEGRVMYESMRLPMAAAGALGRPTLERYLLARHRAIDKLLEDAISNRGVTQVIEVAAGLSPRGWRFTERFGELVYIEGDLPGMVERKREALERMDSLSDRHRVVELDALRPQGATSISGVARGLDHVERARDHHRGAARATCRATRSTGSGGGSRAPPGGSRPAPTSPTFSSRWV